MAEREPIEADGVLELVLLCAVVGADTGVAGAVWAIVQIVRWLTGGG